MIYRISDALNWKGGESYQTFQEFDPTHKYDAIILGSSHAYRGYDPRIFADHGYDVHNLGTSGQSVMNSYFVAKNYITPQNTKLVIFDVFKAPFKGDGLESTADLSQNIPSHTAAVQMGMGLRDIRVINMLSLRFLLSSSEPLYIDSSYVGGGFSEKTDSVSKDITYGKKKFEANPKQLRYFKRLLAYFQEAGIPVVLVNHPGPKAASTTQHAQFRHLLCPIVQEFDVEVLDYSYAHQLDDRHHFFDHNHLNQAGVDEFNPRLIRKLEALNLLGQ